MEKERVGKGDRTYPVNILYGRGRVLFQILPNRLSIGSIDISLSNQLTLPRSNVEDRRTFFAIGKVTP
jgi:hypothetical protein